MGPHTALRNRDPDGMAGVSAFEPGMTHSGTSFAGVNQANMERDL